MSEDGARHLRVLIANEKRERLALLGEVVAGLGHEVIAREIYVKEVGAVTARERPDVALVGLGLSSEHALDLIGEIVREASCPVIALLSAKDPAYVHEAAKRGVFAYIVDGDPQGLQSAIDITFQRFAEYQSLQGAFGRRAVIEQAKGILEPLAPQVGWRPEVASTDLGSVRAGPQRMVPRLPPSTTVGGAIFLPAE
ncbi:MAG: ANTAR domain-containing response regulator [Gaiellaceae bacterium]